MTKKKSTLFHVQPNMPYRSPWINYQGTAVQVNRHSLYNQFKGFKSKTISEIQKLKIKSYKA